MELYKIKKNITGEYDLIINHINIITFDKGLLRLPDCSSLQKLTIFFTCKGSFKISGNKNEITLGNCTDKCVEITPGEHGYDTQPTFIYCDNGWFIMSAGIFIFPEKKGKKRRGY